MTLTARSLLTAVLLVVATSASAAPVPLNDCGDMPKALPAVVKDLRLEKSFCNVTSPQVAKSLHTFIGRYLTATYKSPSGGSGFSVKLSDVRQDPSLIGVKGIPEIIARQKADDKIAEDISTKSSFWAEQYRKRRATLRVVALTKPDEATLTFYPPTTNSAKGFAEVTGAVLGTTSVSIQLSAVDADDAVSIVSQIAGAMNFSMLK